MIFSVAVTLKKIHPWKDLKFIGAGVSRKPPDHDRRSHKIEVSPSMFDEKLPQEVIEIRHYDELELDSAPSTQRAFKQPRQKLRKHETDESKPQIENFRKKSSELLSNFHKLLKLRTKGVDKFPTQEQPRSAHPFSLDNTPPERMPHSLYAENLDVSRYLNELYHEQDNDTFAGKPALCTTQRIQVTPAEEPGTTVAEERNPREAGSHLRVSSKHPMMKTLEQALDDESL